MHTNQTIKSGFYYIGKELDAIVVPTKIDYKNRRFELLTFFLPTGSHVLAEVYHWHALFTLLDRLLDYLVY